jgi:RNA polymerase sigma-70 factor (ECF subfamily)
MERHALASENRSNADLLADCRNGSREAMHDLYVENQRRVYSIALNYFGGDRDKADDVTQQVFLKLLKSINFRGDAEFTTWLYRLTVNQCIDESRRTRRLLPFSEWFSPATATYVSLNERLDSKEISNEVQAFVATLKPKYRVPILLKYVEDLSYQEIAGILDISIGTVSSRLSRGHKMLAAKLGHLRSEI